MLAGIGIFLLGSLLAGFAWSMPVMIGCRVIQGLGAGAMQPVALTIVADLYPAERGQDTRYLACLGRRRGGRTCIGRSHHPLDVLGLDLLDQHSRGYCGRIRIHPVPKGPSDARPPRHRRGRCGFFTVAVTSLLIALTEVGNHRPLQLAAAAAVACMAGVVFVVIERRVGNPIVSFAQWSHRPIAVTNGVGLVASMTLIGLTTFLPIYVQLVMQRSPTIAGLTLTTMLIGWPAGATLAARLFHRYALRHLLLTGAALQPLGALFFVVLTPHMSPLIPAMGSLVMGFGMGLVSVPSLVLIQEIVDSTERGSVTASNIFSRNIGSTLGATLLGAVLNHGLNARALAPVTSDQLRQLLNGR
jgi:predicted MFS family arabinose efflux permease